MDVPTAIMAWAQALRQAQATGRTLRETYQEAGNADGASLMDQATEALDTLINASIELHRAARLTDALAL